MKKLILLILPVLASACAAHEYPSLTWVQGEAEKDGYAVHEITVIGAKGMEELVCDAFCCNSSNTFSIGNSDADVRHVNGNFLRFIPRLSADTLHFRYRTLIHTYWKRSWAPSDFHIKTGGVWSEEIKASYSFLGPQEPLKKTPEFQDTLSLTVADMVPAVKKCIFTGGRTPVSQASEFIVDGIQPEGYRIIIDSTIRLEASDSAGLFYARRSLSRIEENSGGSVVPSLVIEDWPDYPFRGFMLDASRCFYTKDEVIRFIDMMARYRLNKFHFHLTDDDAWRLEMPDYPELTGKGAFSEFPHRGQGLYYSGEDYVQIVRHAAANHIEVIPEIDLPAHSLALMESVPGMVDPGDSSEYLSAQGYHHNVVDVTLPAVYDFVGKVFDRLAALHDDAGVPLRVIHIGGDEVAQGAWMGSPSCRAILKAKGWTSQSDLQNLFTQKLAEMAAERGLKIAGWQEMAAAGGDYAFVNAWTPSTRGDVTTPLIRSGYNVVVSDASALYLDNATGPDVRERGLGWAGYTDINTTFHLSDHPGAYGVEVHIWGENLKHFGDAVYMLWPKSLGAFERTWNTLGNNPDFERFKAVVYKREAGFWRKTMKYEPYEM